MTGETLPGRPGTLTIEQEEKLKQFWVAVLQVFGVHKNDSTALSTPINGASKPFPPGHESPTVVAADGSEQRQRASTIGSEKKKKKRLSFFGRKQNGDEDSSTSVDSTQGHSRDVSHDHDDKYGQNKEFQHALASQTPEELRSAFWGMVKHDHPDGLLLRFLRARKWDAEKALVMLVSTMQWRAKEMHVDDDVIKHGEGAAVDASKSDDPAKKKQGDDFLAQIRMGKSFLHGTDKDGRPICFVRVRLHRQGDQSEESVERYTVYVIETARLMLSPPVDTAAIVFDMTGFSMANMDYGPVKFMIKCFEANYPESLGVVLVHRSPWIFQGIWTIIKGWLDPVVASKVHFTKTVEELEEFVPRNHIIKELGGDEDWSYQFPEPISGENQLMTEEGKMNEISESRAKIVTSFEEATIAWMTSHDNSDSLRPQRNEIATELRRNYWQLDPYIRARTAYDRAGVIREDGTLDFYLKHAAIREIKLSGAPPHTESHQDDVD
ncbi:MAG: hypothetical protein M1814_006504 [Vezdaea aestivalis]|nr:MAG: hypothetical protein M1814_006504 [Vezdaea aestivalis]